MITSEMESIIHYRHSPDEVAELSGAIGPMMNSIRRVSTPWQRMAMKRILAGEFFRAREAINMRNMLIRAVKHSRATLHEIFPLMQAEALSDAQALEDAVKAYWAHFEYLREEVLPTH
jgi:hypothetical protein